MAQEVYLAGFECNSDYGTCFNWVLSNNESTEFREKNCYMETYMFPEGVVYRIRKVNIRYCE